MHKLRRSVRIASPYLNTVPELYVSKNLVVPVYGKKFNANSPVSTPNRVLAEPICRAPRQRAGAVQPTNARGPRPRFLAKSSILASIHMQGWETLPLLLGAAAGAALLQSLRMAGLPPLGAAPHKVPGPVARNHSKALQKLLPKSRQAFSSYYSN
jgi:hypothetical protein